jgi:hypothetical protein
MANKDIIANKIAELRSIYSNPDDQKRFTKLEKKINILLNSLDLSENTVVSDMVAEAKNKIDEINILLSSDEELSEETRKRLFIEKRVIDSLIIKNFSPESLRERLSLQEKAIDSALKRFKN